jgi:hypothetical protein
MGGGRRRFGIREQSLAGPVLQHDGARKNCSSQCEDEIASDELSEHRLSPNYWNS